MAGAVRTYHWKDGKTLELGKKTLLMGILNITPDSFSDGGKWDSLDRAMFHAQDMVRAGADIIDIGAESSRPGFVPMPAEQEMERLAPFLKALLHHVDVPVSVDTFKAETAEMAMKLGAHILNDIWGLQYAPEAGQMAAVAAAYDVPVIVMHNQVGKMYHGDIIRSMRGFFANTVRIAEQAGLRRENLIFDPGIGFGKTPAANMVVLKRLGELTMLDHLEYPLLLGTSRKSFIGAALNLPVSERMEATGATCVMGIMQGCGIVRVHDIKPILRMCRMTDAILEAKIGDGQN